jgi:catalase
LWVRRSFYAGGWFTPHKLTPAEIINTFEYWNEVHPGFRRNHAKGVCITGYFESNGQGQMVSKAQVFVPGRVDVVGRSALAGGLPYAADTPQTVRNLAILLKQPDGQEWRTAMVNIPVFLVNTPQAFNKFQLASSPDPPLVKTFLALWTPFLRTTRKPPLPISLEALISDQVCSGVGGQSGVTQAAATSRPM